MTERATTLGRVHDCLAPAVAREVRMFGTVALMVDGEMLVAVDRDGGLLVRVSAERDPELLTQPHAKRAEMGAGRSMGVGWILVAAQGIGSDEELRAWITAALERRGSKA